MSAYPPPIVALSWTSALGSTVDLQGDPAGIRVNLVQGIDELPATRGPDDMIPFLPGRRRLPLIADRKPIVLQGYVKNSANDEYRAWIEVLKRAMDPTIGPGTLTATLEHGGVRTIAAVPQNLVYANLIRQGRQLSIELDGEPYWRALNDWGTDWTSDMGLLSDDGLESDMNTGPVTLVPASDPDSVEFESLSTSVINDAVIEIDGPSDDDIGIANADVVGFAHPQLSGGETLVVDCGARTATIAGVSVRPDLTFLAGNTRGEFFRIRPGTETVTVTGKPAEVRITFKSTFS